MDFQNIFDDLVGALKDELADGYGAVQGFVESQGKLLAKQAAGIAKSRASGSLSDDDDLFQFFLNNMEANTRNLARHVAMLTILTIERAWNAVANALWGGMRTILSAAGVPEQLLPQNPPTV